MRVFQVLPSMRRAGAESAVATLSVALAACGVQSHLVVLGGRFDYDSDLCDTGVVVHLLRLFQGEVPFYDLRTRLSIRKGVKRLIDEFQPDVIHFHLQHALAFSAHALCQSKAAHFFTFHSLDPIFNGGWRNHLRKQVFLRAVRIGKVRLLAVSHSAARHCATGMGVGQDQIRVQPNPLDLRTWREQVANTKTQARSNKVAIVGTLYPLKRVDVGIRAIQLLAQLGHDFQMVVIGAGPQLDVLKRMVAARGLTESVTFMGIRQDIPQQLRECGALWLLSEREGMPMVALEAMALGLPVIASDVPGTNELVLDGSTGLLVPLGDANAVADRTLDLWRDAELRASITKQAARMVDRYDATIVARQHLAAYCLALESDEIREA